MYVSSFCKLMRMNVFIFSQHGIRAIKEFENTRVRVSPCGQFRQPIQRPCHNPVVLQSSRSLTETKEHCYCGLWRDFPATSILAEEQTNSSASLQSTLWWKARWKKTLHMLTRIDLRSSVEIHVAVLVTLFLHAPPPEGAPAADKPILPLHAPHRRRKSPSFSIFLSSHCYCVFLSPESPLFLCFLELYDIFRTLGVVSVDFY